MVCGWKVYYKLFCNLLQILYLVGVGLLLTFDLPAVVDSQGILYYYLVIFVKVQWYTFIMRLTCMGVNGEGLHLHVVYKNLSVTTSHARIRISTASHARVHNKSCESVSGTTGHMCFI